MSAVVCDSLCEGLQFLYLSFLICRTGKEFLLPRAPCDHVCKSTSLSYNSLPVCKIIIATTHTDTGTFIWMHTLTGALEGMLHQAPGKLCSTAGSPLYLQLAMNTDKPVFICGLQFPHLYCNMVG